MIKSRLLLLADRLEKIDATPLQKRKRRFYMGSWRLFRREPNSRVCCTAACAIGEAAFIKRFRDLGFRFETGMQDPVYKDHYSWPAVSQFFGIGLQTARHLFTSEPYDTHEDDVTPGMVASRIRKVVKAGRAIV